MTYAGFYAVEMYRMSRRRLLRSLLSERYGWAPSELDMNTEDETTEEG